MNVIPNEGWLVNPSAIIPALTVLHRVTPLARKAEYNQSHVTSGVPPQGGTGEGRAWRAPVIAV